MRSAGTQASRDPIWDKGPQNMLTCLIGCQNHPDLAEYNNLPNLLRLLQNYGEKGEGLSDFVKKYGSDYARYQWKDVQNGNQNTIKCFVTILTTALSLMNSKEIAGMFTKQEVDFSALRKQKTVIFVQVDFMDIEFFSFALNLFYISLFRHLMKEHPDTIRARGEECRSVFLLLDEFGHAPVSYMPLILSAVGEYEVSINVILQGISQLYEHYGKAGAETMIQGSFSSKLFLSGLDYETGKLVSNMLGKEVSTNTTRDGRTFHSQKDLKAADRLRVMKRGEAILFSGNHENMLLKTKRYYQVESLLKKTKVPSVPLEKREERAVNYLKL